MHFLGLVAGTTGLEPATSAVTGQRSNQLSYVPGCLLQLPVKSNIIKCRLAVHNAQIPLCPWFGPSPTSRWTLRGHQNNELVLVYQNSAGNQWHRLQACKTNEDRKFHVSDCRNTAGDPRLNTPSWEVRAWANIAIIILDTPLASDGTDSLGGSFQRSIAVSVEPRRDLNTALPSPFLSTKRCRAGLPVHVHGVHEPTVGIGNHRRKSPSVADLDFHDEVNAIYVSGRARKPDRTPNWTPRRQVIDPQGSQFKRQRSGQLNRIFFSEEALCSYTT